MLDSDISYASRFAINDFQDITTAVNMKLDNLLSSFGTSKKVKPTIIEQAMGRECSLKRLGGKMGYLA